MRVSRKGAKVKRVVVLAIATLFTILFSGCSAKNTEFLKQSVPTLRVCVVSKTKVRVSRNGNTIYMQLSEYRKLKNQNRRLRVCNELLNKQNRDFNKRFAR